MRLYNAPNVFDAAENECSLYSRSNKKLDFFYKIIS